MFGEKKHFICVLYYLHTEVIEYDAGHLLHTSRDHAMQMQKVVV